MFYPHDLEFIHLSREFVSSPFLIVPVTLRPCKNMIEIATLMCAAETID
jgi:hypothetical protein